jgi:hypothetical protein
VSVKRRSGNICLGSSQFESQSIQQLQWLWFIHSSGRT